MAYVLITIFLALAGFFFSTAISYFSFYSFQISNSGMAEVGPNLTEVVVGNLFFNLSVILLLLMPILTMRSISDEYKQGTFELLLSYPVSEGQVILGKFFAALAVYAMMLIPVLLHLILLKYVGGTFEWPVVLAGFGGLLLMGMAFLSFGLFSSSLTENQIVSAAVSIGFLLLLWMLSWTSEFLPPMAAKWANEFSMVKHAEGFFRGIVELKHVAFYGLFAIFFLVMSVWRLETRKWLR